MARSGASWKFAFEAELLCMLARASFASASPWTADFLYQYTA